jgi:FkbM family methyltransferase
MLKTIELITHDFSGDVFIDIGGNVGIWTKELYNLYDRILFVEPSSAINEAKENIDDPIGKVRYFKNLCSDKPQVKKSIFSTAESGNFSIYAKELYSESHGIKLTENDIDTISIDSNLLPLVKEGEKVTIKIDTEGAELDILLGGLEFIKKIKPTIIMECHFHMYYDKEKFDNIFKVLIDLEYDIREHKNSEYTGPAIIDGRHTGDEMRNLHYQILMVPK